MRDITLTFADKTQHVYAGVPDDVDPDQVAERAAKDFPDRKLARIDRANGSATPEQPHSVADVIARQRANTPPPPPPEPTIGDRIRGLAADVSHQLGTDQGPGTPPEAAAEGAGDRALAAVRGIPDAVRGLTSTAPVDQSARLAEEAQADQADAAFTDTMRQAGGHIADAARALPGKMGRYAARAGLGILADHATDETAAKLKPYQDALREPTPFDKIPQQPASNGPTPDQPIPISPLEADAGAEVAPGHEAQVADQVAQQRARGVAPPPVPRGTQVVTDPFAPNPRANDSISNVPDRAADHFASQFGGDKTVAGRFARELADKTLDVMQIGPAIYKPLAEGIEMVSGGQITSPVEMIEHSMQGLDQEKSERYHLADARARAIAADPNSTAVDLFRVLSQNPGYTLDVAIPSVGSFAYGAVGAAAGKALGARKALSEGIGGKEGDELIDRYITNGAAHANAIVNGLDNYHETKGDESQKWFSAIFAFLGTHAVNQATEGGAEARLVRGPEARSSANPVWNAVRKGAAAFTNEAANEGGEQLAQDVGQNLAEGKDNDPNQLAKSALNAGMSGGLLGSHALAHPIGDIVAKARGTPSDWSVTRDSVMQGIDDVAVKHGLTPQATAALRDRVTDMEPDKAVEFVQRALHGFEREGMVKRGGSPTAFIDAVQARVDAANPEAAAARKAKAAGPVPASDVLGVAEEDQADGAAPAPGAAAPTVNDVAHAAHGAATSPLNDTPEPTDAMKAAGNYQVGRVRLHGMDISVENPAGSVRSGTSPDGNTWSNTLPGHYGYIRGTKAGDGDHLDVTIGRNPASQLAVVIDQVDPHTGKFDEPKAFLGVDSQEEAVDLYRRSFAPDWNGLGGVTTMPIDEFKRWAFDGVKDKPLTDLKDWKPDAVRPSADAGGSSATVDSGGPAGRGDERGGGVAVGRPGADDAARRVGVDSEQPAGVVGSVRPVAGADGADAALSSPRLMGKPVGERTDDFLRRVANMASAPEATRKVAADELERRAAAAAPAPETTTLPAGAEEFPIANIRRKNGAIGTQGVSEAGIHDVLTHLAGMTIQDGTSMKDMLDQLRADPAAQARLRDAVRREPIKVDHLPDDTYHVEDGHHRAFLLNQLGDETVPALVDGGRAAPAASAPAAPAPAAPAGRATRSGSAKHPDKVNGSKILAIVSKELGGLDPGSLADFSHRFETKTRGKDGRPITRWRNPLIPGVGTLFRPGGTSDHTELARVLEDHGYLTKGSLERDPTEASRKAVELVQGALNRSEAQTEDEHLAELEAARNAEADAHWANVDAQTAQHLEDERDAILRENDIPAADLNALSDDDIPWDLPAGPRNLQAEADFLGIPLEEYEREQAQAAQGPQDHQQDPGPAADGAKPPAEAGGAAPRADAAEGLTLEAQTPAQLQARAEREAAAKKAADAEQKRLGDKAKADAEVGEFTLTGSDRPRDVAAAGGQTGMFDDQGHGIDEERARQAKAEADAHEARRAAMTERQRTIADHAYDQMGDGPLADRARAVIDRLRENGLDDLANAIGMGFSTDLKTRGGLTEEGVAHRENVAQRELANKARGGPVPWKDVTAADMAARDDTIAALPEALQQAAADRWNEVGPRLAALGFTDPHQVHGGAPQAARTVAQELRDIQGTLMSLAPQRYREAQGKARDDKIAHAEDEASRILGIDTRAHPGVDMTYPITADGVQKIQLPRAPAKPKAPKEAPAPDLLTAAAGPLDPAETGKGPLPIPEADFAAALQGAITDDGDEWRSPFTEPAKTVRVETLAKADGVLTPEQAAEKLAEWKAHAAAQGKAGVNRGRVVLSLFDASGIMAKPWREAGYDVHLVDLQHGHDVAEFTAASLTDDTGLENVYAVLAQPPCTDFASSGAQWWKDKDADGRTEASVHLVSQTLATVELFKPAVWSLENPVGRIQKLAGLPKPRLIFNPNNFGDPYTKKTLLWGDFETGLPLANVDPTEGSKIANLSSEDKFGRSLTPEGFAYAFFMANNADDLGPARRLAREFRGTDIQTIADALANGHTEADVKAAIEDAWNDGDQEGVDEALQALIGPEPDEGPLKPDTFRIHEGKDKKAELETFHGRFREGDRVVVDGKPGTITETAFYAAPKVTFDGKKKPVSVPAPDLRAPTAAAPSPAPAPAPAPSGNRVFTDDMAAAARARLKAKLKNQLNTGIDPELLQDGIILAGWHLENGARKFADFARNMLADLGEGVRPYLRSWYMAAKFDPRAGHLAPDMSSAAEVEATDVATIKADAEAPAPTPAPAPAPAQHDIIEHVTKGGTGKTLRGVVRKDLTQAEAEAIDPATFKKNGGFFIREKHLPLLEAKTAPRAPVDAPPAPKEAPKDAVAAPKEDAGPAALVSHLRQLIVQGGMPKDNPALAKIVREFDGGREVTPARQKEAQEALEAAIAQRVRELVHFAPAIGKTPRVVFNDLVDLYQSQPLLNVRTSGSIERQAYSTPAPLAYVAARLAEVTRLTTVLEPTAGTGMLLVTADPAKTVTNEIDPARRALLVANGFRPSGEDATKTGSDGLGDLVTPHSIDRVITNPPFGPIKDANGESIKVRRDGYILGQVDHLIAANALDAMKNDGHAVLIIGANKEAGAMSNNDLVFFNWLHSHYRVVDHFEVDGKLYERQGAGWPVRVITIAGRVPSSNTAPRAGSVERVSSWEGVYERFEKGMGAVRALGGTAPGAVGPRPGPTDDGRAVPGAAGGQAAGGNRRGPEGGAPRDGNVAGGGAGPVGGRGERAPQPVGGEPAADGQRAGPAAPRPVDGNPATPAGRTARDSGVARAPVLTDAENQFQAKYVPRSSRKDEGVLIPVNMAQPTQDALDALEDAVGDIDHYAADQLGYPSVDQMHTHLMGLQVDSVASAIFQIGRGKAVVIADQTGIGKGRQAAAVIRWAVRQGHVPVFVTVKPSLFTDMFGDLHDIGTDDVAPFIMNLAESIKSSSGEALFTNRPGQHRRNLESIAATGTLPAGRNALFMTYSQINTENLQRQAVMALADRAVFILDESHNAGGESATGEFVRGALDVAKGVTYLSATYAKRPDNMPLYFKTDMGEAAADSGALMAAMDAGGLPLQTVVSHNLVKAGQMFRRERSYDGVEIVTKADTDHTDEHRKLSDETTKALRAIVDADHTFHTTYVKHLQDELKEQQSGDRVLDMAGNQAKESVNHTEFSSVVHNFVRQMLLGLKAQTAADDAIASLKRGEKPLIAVENTMGSFLNEYAEANGLKPGDPLGTFDYRNVLTRALARSRYLVRQLPTGDKVREDVPLSKLDPLSRAKYDAAQKIIDRLELTIPVSPIDWMRQQITNAGFTVKEITGRDLAVDYSDPKAPKVSRVDEAEQKDKVATTRAFNDGTLDAIILNVAGSTGISLHASEKFADQRQRHMIVGQAAQDINIFMQMLGRIHRTGQVRLPKYTILNVDLPAEKRPTALLAKKMKSLNANTSSNTESATSVKTADMLNKYGDRVVQQYLDDNLELAELLGLKDLLGGEDEEGNGTEDIARKATGRLALMPVATQEQFYADVEDQYHALIDYLNKTNQNDLEPRTIDFDARELRSDPVFEGENPDSPFGQDANLVTYSVKAQGKPMTPDEIRAEMANSLGGLTPAAHLKKMAEPLLLDAQQRRQAYNMEDPDHVGRALIFDNVVRAGTALLESHPIGQMLRVEINGEHYNAIVTNIRNTHKKGGNPYSLSKFQVTLALNGAMRQVTVPGTQLAKITTSQLPAHYNMDQLFKAPPANERAEAKIIVGNLLGAYGELQGGVRGSVVTFTKEDGTTEQGILMPKGFDAVKNVRQDYRLKSGADAVAFLTQGRSKDLDKLGIQSRDGVVRVTPLGRDITITVPKSKAKGGKYFLDAGLREAAGEFVSSGGMMRVTVPAAKAAAALDVLMRKAALYVNPSMVAEARTIVGDEPPPRGPGGGLPLSSQGSVFYSPLERAVQGAKMGAAPAGAWAQFLKGLVQKGVKPDELAWSGVNEWLALQTGKVTKDALLDYLAKGGVQVQETVLQDAATAQWAVNDALAAAGIDGYQAFDDGDGTLAFTTGNGEMEALDFDELPEDVQAVVRSVAPDDTKPTKYSTYTLPGGKDYRELLLTLPAPPLDVSSDAYRSKAAELYGQASVDRLSPEQQAIVARKLATDHGATYQSSHWQGHPNVLAHVRFNERSDADGRRVLFIEEIQSDWGQAAKKQGYQQLPATAEELRAAADKVREADDAMEAAKSLREMRAGAVRDFHKKLEKMFLDPRNSASELQDAQRHYDELRERMHEAIADHQDANVALTQAMQEQNVLTERHQKGVPRAPFVDKTDAWVALAIKRMVKWGVDHGYDRVAFVNGDQSADRYQLSKHIQQVSFTDNSTGGVGLASMDGPPGRGVLTAWDNNGKRVIDEHMEAEKVEDYIGKELAQRLFSVTPKPGSSAGINNRSRTLSGLDLKVGGEGMHAFYDKIVPTVAKEVVKKLGGEGLTTVPIVDPRGTGRTMTSTGLDGRPVTTKIADEPALPQLGFDITQRMRELAADGVPLFAHDALAKTPTAPPAVASTARAGVDPKQLRDYISRLTMTWDNAPDIHVVAAAAYLPDDVKASLTSLSALRTTRALIMPGADGSFFNANVYIIADRNRTLDGALAALMHEVMGHYGIRGFLESDDAYRTAMYQLRQANPDIAARAAKWMELHGKNQEDGRILNGMPTHAAKAEVRALATEEALADRAMLNEPIRGWQKLMARVQRFLRSIGWDGLANRLERMTEAETLSLLAHAREFVRGSQAPVSFPSAGAAAISSMVGDEGTPLDEAAAPGPVLRPSTAPLDAALRLTVGQAGKLTGPAYTALIDMLDRGATATFGDAYLTAKAGLSSDVGLDDAYKEARANMRVGLNRGTREAATVLDDLASLDAAQSRIAYLWMTTPMGDADADRESAAKFQEVERQLTEALPEDSRRVLEQLKQRISELGAAAVELGLLSHDSYERNRMSYLHRTYEKYARQAAKGDQAQFAAMRTKAVKLLGDQFKGRGLRDDVGMEKIADTDWWKQRREAGQADTSLKGQKFKRLELRSTPDLATPDMHGGRGERLGKLRKVLYWPVNEPIPRHLADWRDDGVWEARFFDKGGKVGMWRDFTLDERTKMGEIQEARYAAARTILGATRDVEVARMLKWVAENVAEIDPDNLPVGAELASGDGRPSDSLLRAYRTNEWVRVPDMTIPGTGLKKWGHLAGRYVPGPVWNDLRQVASMADEGELMRAYGKVLNLWKISKTALSPATHMNNVVSNFILADAHDIQARHIARALKLWVDVRRKDPEALAVLHRYQDHGGDGGKFTEGELKQDVQRQLVAALDGLLGKEGGPSALFTVSAAFDLMRHGEIRQAIALASQSRGTRLAKAAVDKLIKLYGHEDEVFRMAAFLKAQDDGLDDHQAGKFARESFLDYNINAPWVQLARKSFFPFIAFTYRAVPMMARTIADKPHKLAKWMMVAWAANHLAYMMLGGGGGGDDDKEARERAMLPDDKQGRTAIGTPKLLRMPWDSDMKDRDGNVIGQAPVFLDTRRWIPGGDLFDTTGDKTAFPMVQNLMPGGPVWILAETILNTDGFTGKPIHQQTDTMGERWSKVGDHLWKAAAPNNPLVPGSFAWDKMASTLKDHPKTDLLGREYSAAQALLNTIGVKVSSYAPDQLAVNAQLDARAKLNEIRDTLKKAMRDNRRNGMSNEDLQKLIAVKTAQAKQIQDDLAAKTRQAKGLQATP